MRGIEGSGRNTETEREIDIGERHQRQRWKDRMS